MAVRKALSFLWRILVTTLVFHVSFILGSLVARWAGLSAPSLPAGTDAETLGLYQLLVSLLFAVTLAFIACHLTGSFLARWLTLALFSWVSYGLNTYLEARIFTTYEAASAYTLIMQFFATLLCSAAVAWLFAPLGRGKSLGVNARAFLRRRRPSQWVWRFVATWLAFPAIYLLFGSFVQPHIIQYYQQQMAGLTLPGWDKIIPALAIRSLLFLIATVPMLIYWRGTRSRLLVTLGIALFVLVGGLYMLQSYWMPTALRVLHSLEILADSLAYAAVTVNLLVRADDVTS